MPGFVDTTVKDIDSRIKELQDELTKLQAARSALVGSAPARRGPGRPRGTTRAATHAAKPAKRRPGRPRGRRGGNTRSNQALELVRKQPGITIPQVAEALKIEPNYLYRVMPKLVSDGLITRDGLGYHPAAA
jgi:Winged helix-turn-helix DNA-binding